MVLLNLILLIVMFADPSFASEGAGDWRPTYDLAMRWFNFIIFVAVIAKFGAKPLKELIGQQREEISGGIEKLEKQKEEMEAQVRQTLKMGEESRKQLENLRNRILTEGERHKSEIIEEAKLKSALVIQDAKRKVESRILSAKVKFRKQLIDAATEIALHKLPQTVTFEDQEKRLDQFFSTLETTS